MAAALDFEQKICARADFEARAAKLPRPLVFTNGCFDVLHRGHVTYLAQARALGAALVVGVNSDASVKRLEKGDDRPVNSQNDRMSVLAALQAVDLTWSDGSLQRRASEMTAFQAQVLATLGWPEPATYACLAPIMR